MLSRVADSIYWMNRFIERAENVARFVDVNLHLGLDLPATEAEQWEPIINTTGDRATFEEHFDAYTGVNVIRFLTFDPDYPNSILGCLHRARENARSVREVISSEVWEQVNRFYLMVRNAAFSDTGVIYAPHEFFTEVKMASHLFAGISDATMSHEEAWHWGQLGRLTERADKTSRILDVKYFILLPDPSYVGTPYDNIQWAALLRSASALEMYRRRFGRIDPLRVVEFLVLDRYFPRAIRFCLRRTEDSLRALTGSPEGTYRNRPEQLLGRLRAELDFASTEEIVAKGLHEFLDDFQAKLNRVGEATFDAFFALEPSEDGDGRGDGATGSTAQVASRRQLQSQRT